MVLTALATLLSGSWPPLYIMTSVADAFTSGDEESPQVFVLAAPSRRPPRVQRGCYLRERVEDDLRKALQTAPLSDFRARRRPLTFYLPVCCDGADGRPLRVVGYGIAVSVVCGRHPMQCSSTDMSV